MEKKFKKIFLLHLFKAESILKKGNTILYPTDTVWGIGCDATNTAAVRKVFKLKKRHESKSLVILVNSIDMLLEYIPNIPNAAIELIKDTTKPTSIIYSNPIGLAENVVAGDNTVAIRIPKDEFCQKLIENFGKPIVSTSANISESPTPTCFNDIQSELVQNVDYIVDLQQEKINKQSSQILKIMKDGTIITIRE